MQSYAAHFVMIRSRRGILFWKRRGGERSIIYGHPVNKGESGIYSKYEIVVGILSVDNEIDGER